MVRGGSKIMETKNIYVKLVEARVRFQESKIEKTGNNSFAKYKYFQLDDFIPAIDKINKELGLCTIFNLTDNEATLTMVNVDNPSEVIVFNAPSEKVEIKGATSVQNLGGEITYLKRYLYQNAYEITEPDLVEGVAQVNKTLLTPKTYAPKQPQKASEELIQEAMNLMGDDFNRVISFYKVSTPQELTQDQLNNSIKAYKRTHGGN